jgi:hypothetical protein
VVDPGPESLAAVDATAVDGALLLDEAVDFTKFLTKYF